MNKTVQLNLILFVLGLAGVLSMLASPLPPLPESATQQIAPGVLRWLILINPTVMILLSVLIGGFLSGRVGLRAPLLEAILHGRSASGIAIRQITYGIPAGLLAGGIISLLLWVSKPHLPAEYLALGETMKLSPITRFLYGGIAEEILLRWGMMTLFVWIIWKIAGRKNPTPLSGHYWLGILLAAVLFGLGHLPALFVMLEQPTALLVIVLVTANALFGIIAGWLYWKQGLESAMIAHIFSHVLFLLLGTA